MYDMFSANHRKRIFHEELNTVKLVLSGHQNRQNKGLKDKLKIMKVESFADCNTFDLRS